MAPYMAEELWSVIARNEMTKQSRTGSPRSARDDTPISVHIAQWPEAEEKYLVEEKIKIMISVNGKIRGELEIDAVNSAKQNEIIEMAKNMEKIKPWIEGKKIIKEIYVQGRILNLVVS